MCLSFSEPQWGLGKVKEGGGAFIREGASNGTFRVFGYIFFLFLVHTTNNSVAIPEGCAPTNYSGTQINFWGCAPNLNPGKWVQDVQGAQNNNGANYGNSYPSQLGALTNKMITVCLFLFSYIMLISFYTILYATRYLRQTPSCQTPNLLILRSP